MRTASSLKNNWVKELRDGGIVKVNQIPADINISDFLTKPLPGYKVKKYCKLFIRKNIIILPLLSVQKIIEVLQRFVIKFSKINRIF